MKQLVSLSAMLFFFSGCGLMSKTTVQAKNTYTFDYAPKAAAKSGSSNFIIGLVSPQYATDFTSGGTELFKRFRNALGSDVEELIIAQGFTLKGPYQELDEMVFEDKKRTDLLIWVEISPSFTAFEGGWKTHLAIVGGATYSYSGKVSMVGKINLSGVEPLTNEKIWVKSVLIPKIENIEIKTSSRYSEPLNGLQILGDPGVYNAIGKALQEQYVGILSKIESHLNPDEFATLKNQIKELKAKKGY